MPFTHRLVEGLRQVDYAEGQNIIFACRSQIAKKLTVRYA